MTLPDFLMQPSFDGLHQFPEIPVPPGGTDPRSLTPNLFDIIGRALELWLRKVVQAFLGQFPGGDTAFNILSQFGEDLNNFIHGIVDGFVNVVDGTVGTVGNFISDFVTSVQTVIDFLTQGADGTGATGNNMAQAKGAVASLRESVVGNSALLAGVDADALDQFNRTGSDLGADWTVIYVGGNGTWIPNGTSAFWAASFPNGTREFAARWEGAAGTESTDDYQKVTLVLSSAPGQAFGLYGYNDILVRCDDSPTIDNYVRARIGADGSWSIDAIVSNVVNNLFGGVTTPPGAGAVIDFYAGERATSSPRRFCLRINGVDVLAFTTEGGTTSLYGSPYRHWGHGGRAESVAFSLTVDAVPGQVNQWSVKSL